MSRIDDTFGAYWARRAVRKKIIKDIYPSDQPQSIQPPPLRHGFVEFDPSPGNEVRRFTPDDLPEDPRRADEPTAGSSFALMSADDSTSVLPPPPGWPEKSKVCIIGAGVTGLYIAMILDSLQLPGLTYEILEGSERIGGRMLTHRFSEDAHDYYDIGAMRFPHLPIMDRTFDLFKRLDIKLRKYWLDPRNEDSTADGSEMCPTMFNDICVVDDGKRPKPPPFDPFKVSVKSEGVVPDDLVKEGASAVLGRAFNKYKEIMAEDFEKGYDELMKVDHLSTRQYLRERLKLNGYAIQWLETNGTSTNLFDQAFTESVIDSFDFDPPKGEDAGTWSCIEGGTSRVTEAMEEKLKNGYGKLETLKRVRKITQLDNENLVVSVAGEAKPRDPYTTVFNTTSLGCLGRMDLTGLKLHPMQKDAIRSLHYDDSAKVAIKFSYPWWITHCGITRGGAGNTDLPLRTCVYPSYNVDDDKTKPAVLLCSYTWSQDALRVGSLIEQTLASKHDAQPQDKEPQSKNEEQLMDLMFDNLARLHLANLNKNSGRSYTLEEARALIEGSYLTHHAYSWSHDPFTSGAFALFGPGQFRDIYPYLNRPTAKSRFHILGEASGAHHAWIVGSLESAYSGVYKFLDKYQLWDYQQKMIDEWGTIPEFKDEMGKKGSIWLQVALGIVDDPTSLAVRLQPKQPVAA